MSGLKKLLKQISFKSNVINLLMGVVFAVSILLIFQNSTNRYTILAACTSGGIMNILNGINFMKDSKRKTMGMTFMMMGAIIILLGFLVVDML